MKRINDLPRCFFESDEKDMCFLRFYILNSLYAALRLVKVFQTLLQGYSQRMIKVSGLLSCLPCSKDSSSSYSVRTAQLLNQLSSLKHLREKCDLHLFSLRTTQNCVLNFLTWTCTLRSPRSAFVTVDDVPLLTVISTARDGVSSACGEVRKL